MPTKRTLMWLLLGAALFFAPNLRAAEPRYDVVIRNGKVVDGTGNPWFFADVAIQGDRIVDLGKIKEAGTREIDAKGLVVAPGFIDIHSHSDWVLLEDGNAHSKIRQGVTTEVLGEGSSVAPQKLRLQPSGAGRAVSTFQEYFDSVEKAGIAVNVLSYVGLGNIWQSVMGQSFSRPSPEDFKAMKELLAEAMRGGAFGLSTSLLMPPNSLATTDDLVELCSVVRDFGGIYSTHIRDEGLGVFDSIREAIAVGERAGVPVDILHLKIADQKYWGRMKEVSSLIETARKRGVNVTANIYPYTRGNNDLASIIPPWAHEGGRAEMVARLKDQSLRARLKRDITNGVAGWYNHYTAVGGDWSRMLVSANNAYQGLTMDRVLASRAAGKTPPPDPIDLFIDLLIEQNGSVSTVYAHHTEEDMNFGLQQPWCSIGSDGSALSIEGVLRRGHPHPRNFGTFPRVLGVYVRERGVLKLEEAIRKMTSLNAAKLGLLERGLLRAGCFADIAIFDPEKVIDRSTYTEPFHYSEGIEYVFVNGKLTLDRGQHTGARAGRALRNQN